LFSINHWEQSPFLTSFCQVLLPSRGSRYHGYYNPKVNKVKQEILISGKKIVVWGMKNKVHGIGGKCSARPTLYACGSSTTSRTGQLSRALQRQVVISCFLSDFCQAPVSGAHFWQECSAGD
jgi:hypothetical protein